MRVYVIRHGQSVNNLAQKWTGWMDVPLTEKGKQDAKNAGALIAHVKFDRIYASDLQRARQTAETAIPGCAYETSALLREVNIGTLAGRPASFLNEAQRARVSKEGYVEFGGESSEEFRGRVQTFMRQLEDEPCETVAVFAHAGVLRNMLNAVLDVQLSGRHVYCDNCAVAIFEYTENNWRLHSWINFPL